MPKPHVDSRSNSDRADSYSNPYAKRAKRLHRDHAERAAKSSVPNRDTEYIDRFTPSDSADDMYINAADMNADGDIRTTRSANNDVQEHVSSMSAEHTAPTFAQLGVPNALVRVLAKDGKTTAFPIQADTLADSMAGRDLLGRGQTGSGKTLAFAIPLVSRLSVDSGSDVAIRSFERWREHGDARSKVDAMLPRPRGMVLAPTRELVNQIDDVIRPLAEAYGMTTTTMYGGVNQNRQVVALRNGADIIVACPGRLEDLLRQRLLSLDCVEITVLDEADEMADMGFLPSVSRLLSQVDSDGQRMLFSATLDHGVDKLVNKYLTDAKIHAVDSAQSHVDTMTHHVFAVSQGNKHEVIRVLASGKGKRILFTRTKYQAKKMAKKLVDAGIPAVDLQGNLSQNARDRHMAAFANGEVRVMVATDVAARGIDISDVAMVVQTEPPEDPKSFLHRSGRTARAGETGDVVTLVLPEQQREARQMLRQAGINVRSEEITPASAVLQELVGEPAPLVKNWSLPVPQANKPSNQSKGKANSRNRRSGRGNARPDSRERDERHTANRYDGKRSESTGGGRSRSDRRGSRGSERDMYGDDSYGRDSSGQGTHGRGADGRGSQSQGSHGHHGNNHDDSHSNAYESERGSRGRSSRGYGSHGNGGEESRTANGFRRAHKKSIRKNAAPFRRGR